MYTVRIIVFVTQQNHSLLKVKLQPSSLPFNGEETGEWEASGFNVSIFHALGENPSLKRRYKSPRYVLEHNSRGSRVYFH